MWSPGCGRGRDHGADLLVWAVGDVGVDVVWIVVDCGSPIQCVEVGCLVGLSTWSLLSRMCECGRAPPPPPIGTLRCVALLSVVVAQKVVGG